MSAGDKFGFSIAVDGDIALIGAMRGDGESIDSGTAYLYDLNTRELLHKFVAPLGNRDDRFGWDVALDDGVAFIGAPRGDIAGEDAGAVYLFDASSGNFLNTLVPEDPSIGGEFGFSVAADSGLIVAGAPNGDDGNFRGAGYVFDVATREQRHRFTLPEETFRNSLGWDVDIDDGLVLLGAASSSAANPIAGAAYVFDAITGDRLATLVDSDWVNGDSAGDAVSLLDGVAIVGANRTDSPEADAGAVYLFDAITGQQQSEIRGEGYSTALGYTVLLADQYTIAYRSLQTQGSSAVQINDRSTGSIVATLNLDPPQAYDFFGFSLGANSNLLMVGAPDDAISRSDGGAVHVFSLVPEPSGAAAISLMALLLVGRKRRMAEVEGIIRSPRRA